MNPKKKSIEESDSKLKEENTYDSVFIRQKSYFQEINKNDNNFKVDIAQKSIEQSKVMILGLGGIGSNIATCLAQTGIREIYVVDFDIVEASNLNRTDGFSNNDVGLRKTKIIKKYIESNFPWCNIIILEKKINSEKDFEEILSISKNIDLIVSCVDKPSNVKYIISDSCVKNKIPFIKGGYSTQYGGIGPFFIPKKSGCLRCFEKYLFKNNNPVNQDKFEVTPSVPWISKTISNLMVNEIISFLSKASTVKLINKYLQIDFLNLNFNLVEIRKKKKCKYCKIGFQKQDKYFAPVSAEMSMMLNRNKI